MKYYTLEQLSPLLHQVQKPARYVGGEFGSYSKFDNNDSETLNIAICFPDLYEIGMSNQAVKILYHLFNSMDGVRCERVYAPQSDFERALKDHSLSLYSLETYTPIKEFDLLAFSIGYELSFTSILNILQCSGIALKNKDRSEEDPLVIAGGPALTNPIPFGAFIDYIFIGEAEERLHSWVNKILQLKREKAGRKERAKVFQQEEAFWYAGKLEKTKVSRWKSFGQNQSTLAVSSGTPIPSMKIVQDHGVVEIMRGCPNKCRFCHAGIFYRPKREKSPREILKEVDYLVHHCGYRSITLSSLSTGDYKGIDQLVHWLNTQYSPWGVSFNLPSLRVNSISLELLNLVSVVRKSGLTFAVEAPTEAAQHALNKDVSTSRIIEILKEAAGKGWRQAKFYFMLGLPVSPENEEEKIIEYLNHIQHESRIQLNINVGTFIPKTFTPFSRSKQMQEEQSLAKIRYLKKNINNKRIRISYHSPFASFLEGIFARGDEQAGELALKAFQEGARLDAWDDCIDRKLWRRLIEEKGLFWEESICNSNAIQDRLDKIIDMDVRPEHFLNEEAKAQAGTLTKPCEFPCKEHCGVCSKELKVKEDWSVEEILQMHEVQKPQEYDIETSLNVLIAFKKSCSAVFLGHLDLMHVFERAFVRCKIPVAMSQGFNPKPRMEFASPLSLGVDTHEDVFSVKLLGQKDKLEKLLHTLNNFLPEGIRISKFKFTEESGKLRLMANYKGSRWTINGVNAELCSRLIEDLEKHDLQNVIKLQEEKGVIHLFMPIENTPYKNPVKWMVQSDIPGFSPDAGLRITRISQFAFDNAGKAVNIYNLYE